MIFIKLPNLKIQHNGNTTDYHVPKLYNKFPKLVRIQNINNLKLRARHILLHFSFYSTEKSLKHRTVLVNNGVILETDMKQTWDILLLLVFYGIEEYFIQTCLPYLQYDSRI